MVLDHRIAAIRLMIIDRRCVTRAAGEHPLLSEP
jgi:hypothetical protein